MRSFWKQRYMPFTYKMMIPYLLLVLLTDVLIGYMSYTVLTESRTEMAETTIRTGMEQARNNIRYQMDEIERMSDSMFGSSSFQRALQVKGEPYDIYLTMTDYIIPEITAPLRLFGNSIRLMLFTPNSDLNVVAGDNPEMPIKDSDYYILPLSEVEGTRWFETLRGSGQDDIWLQIDTDRKLGNISHFRKLISYSDYSTIGYLRITASLEDLFGDFDTFPVEEGFTVSLKDIGLNETLFQRGPGDGIARKSDYLRLEEPIPGTSFVVETQVPSEYLTKNARKLQRLILFVCSISFVGMALIGFLVARLSGRKMSRITAMLHAFQEGNLEKRLRFSGNDEFVQIADAFNVMAGNIKELIKRVYVQGLQKKQAELEALQAQINPHFLYNTLSTINSLANLGEIGKVTEMVQGLSRFYRLTLNEGLSTISLEKELEQVGTYLDIQRVKYADAFKIYMEVDPEIKETPVIKLILQPFVENIFKHAWFGESIAIIIRGRKVNNTIELSVIDNGIGMRKQTLDSLLGGGAEAAGRSGGYGIRNVDERIKLRYGEGYGVQIGSLYGAGTAVRIVLPADGGNEEEEARLLQTDPQDTQRRER
ncbi:sensor histidine kinase [Paenibacillus sp. CN-4]|uniref:sensor histidine kinase n=1 Tax=Paenibacillus nanchangensis TaxID=3348343 RepID=UPI003978BF10